MQKFKKGLKLLKEVKLSILNSDYNYLIEETEKRLNQKSGKDVDKKKKDPAINVVVFPNTFGDTYWTSVNDKNRLSAWYVYYGDGFVGSNHSLSVPHSVRLVRSTKQLGSHAP